MYLVKRPSNKVFKDQTPSRLLELNQMICQRKHQIISFHQKQDRLAVLPQSKKVSSLNPSSAEVFVCMSSSRLGSSHSPSTSRTGDSKPTGGGNVSSCLCDALGIRRIDNEWKDKTNIFIKGIIGFLHLVTSAAFAV